MTAALIVLLVVWAAGTLLTGAAWLTHWQTCRTSQWDDIRAGTPDAARGVLHAPLWPLTLTTWVTRTARQLWADAQHKEQQ